MVQLKWACNLPVPRGVRLQPQAQIIHILAQVADIRAHGVAGVINGVGEGKGRVRAPTQAGTQRVLAGIRGLADGVRRLTGIFDDCIVARSAALVDFFADG